MSPRARPAQLVLRSTALLLALACLWLSSGATLRHTDDLGAFLTFRAGRDTCGHTAPAPAAIQCLAHVWMNAWQALHTSRPAVSWTTVTLALVSLSPAPALHLRPFDYTALRGPPPAPA